RVVVARAESGRLRVIGRAETAVPRDAIVGGLVVDPPAVSDALGAAVAAAERGTASDRAVIAIDGDDVRTYHVSTPFEREASAAPITRAEIDRALREARDDAARHAQTEVDEDPALRGVATARLADDVLAAREATRDEDARVWAECVALPLRSQDAPAPERWLFVGVPETLLALPNALREIVQTARGAAPRIGPLNPGITGRVFSDVPVHAEDLVAVGAAALASEVYAGPSRR